MGINGDAYDRLARALVVSEADFDAVERGGLRAFWTNENRSVAVVDRETGEEIVYTADDLVLATSVRELQNARKSGYR